MHQVNIHEAKTNLSKLIDSAVHGKPFIIAKAGRPLVKVEAISVPTSGKVQRLGFMKGQITIPANFDRMSDQEIEDMFGSNE